MSVMIMPGGKPTMFMSIMMFGEPGVDILYPDPGFPIYRSMIEYTGANPVPVPIREENGFAFSAEETLKLITPKTRLLILNSPANPTGGVTPKSEVDKLVAGLEKFPDVAIMSDEIYDHMTYDGEKHVCLLTYPSIRDRLIMLNGWSKTYAMTGWRLGYAVWPGKLYDYARKLAVNLHSCVNASAQYAGIAALTGPQDEVAKMVRGIRQAPQSRGRGPEQIAGRLLRDAEGRVLCIPECEADRLEGEGAGVVAAGGCRRRHHRRTGFRNSRRRLYARVLRQLDREHSQGARPHGRIPGEPQGGVTMLIVRIAAFALIGLVLLAEASVCANLSAISLRGRRAIVGRLCREIESRLCPARRQGDHPAAAPVRLGCALRQKRRDILDQGQRRAAQAPEEEVDAVQDGRTRPISGFHREPESDHDNCKPDKSHRGRDFADHDNAEDDGENRHKRREHRGAA